MFQYISHSCCSFYCKYCKHCNYSDPSNLCCLYLCFAHSTGHRHINVFNHEASRFAVFLWWVNNNNNNNNNNMVYTTTVCSGFPSAAKSECLWASFCSGLTSGSHPNKPWNILLSCVRTCLREALYGHVFVSHCTDMSSWGTVLPYDRRIPLEVMWYLNNRYTRGSVPWKVPTLSSKPTLSHT